MEAKKFPFVYVLLIIISAACLFLFISREAANAKSYVRFDGKYYYASIINSSLSKLKAAEAFGKNLL